MLALRSQVKKLEVPDCENDVENEFKIEMNVTQEENNSEYQLNVQNEFDRDNHAINLINDIDNNIIY